MFRSLICVFGFVGGCLLAASLPIRSSRAEEFTEEPAAAVTKQIVQANSDFALDLYREVAAERSDANLFFSPYSISTALAMTVEGARDQTAAEMGRVLRFPETARRVGDPALPWDTSGIHFGMAALLRRFTGKGDPADVRRIRQRIEKLREQLAEVNKEATRLQMARKWREAMQVADKQRSIARQLNGELAKVDRYEIRVANALWGEQTYPFRREYIDTLGKYYGTGGLFPVDFRQNHEAARQQINKWVADQTKDLIPNLIPQGALNDLARLVLTNAIYFKGDWAVPFDSDFTSQQEFTRADRSKVKTPLMVIKYHKQVRYAAFNADGSYFNSPQMMERGKSDGLYPDSDGFAIVELPYRGDELSMVVMAPNDPAGLAELEGKLSTANLTKWIAQLNQRTTHVYLPKFKLETTYTLGSGGSKPSGTLPRMGMVRAFTDPGNRESGAQFDGMTDSDNIDDKLYISKVLHRAVVDVTEEGTEAAAATAVIMAAPVAAFTRVPFVPTFRADRPFVFVIRDKTTGTILFMGRMMDPQEQG